MKNYHEIGKNLRFFSEHMNKKTPLYWIYLIVNVFSGLANSLLVAYLSSQAIDRISDVNCTWGDSAKFILSCTVLIIISIVLRECTLRMLNTSIYKVSSAMLNDIEEITINCNYQYVENEAAQEKLYEATDIVFGGDAVGISGMAHAMNQLLLGILGIVIYGVILGGFSLFILPIILVSSVLSFMINLKLASLENKKREDSIPYKKEESYIYHKVATEKSAKDIKLYNGSSYFISKIKMAAEQRFHAISSFLRKKTMMDLIPFVFILVQNILIVFFLAKRVSTNVISIGSFLWYTQACTDFSIYFNILIKSISSFTRNCLELSVVSDCFEMLEEKKNLQKYTFDSAPEIRLENVSYHYPNSTENVISDISLRILPGEKIGIVGENGAGKTTLIKLISGLYTPTSGSIYINDKDMNLLADQSKYDLSAPVFQDIMILPMSILDNINPDSGKSEDTKLEKLWEASDLKLKYDINQFLVKDSIEDAIDLSGGEQQKLIMLRALYKDAPVLILDEPTAALDPIAEDSFYQQYNTMTKNKTSLFISHRLASTRFCDRIIYFENGKIAEIGSHQELMERHGKYAAMFELQSRQYQEHNEVI